MNRFILLSIGLFILGCNQTDRESLKDYIEFKVDSDNYVRLTMDQKLDWNLFNGDPKGNAPYESYFGTYFYWDFDQDNELKFNATVYFDRTKSWVREKDEWAEGQNYFNEIPEMLKLKFDYH